jgi:hypothetical protein
MGAGDVLGVTIPTVEDDVNDRYGEASRMSATGQRRMLILHGNMPISSRSKCA